MAAHFLDTSQMSIDIRDFSRPHLNLLLPIAIKVLEVTKDCLSEGI